MITSIEKFGINIRKISDTGTERSYYRFVCQFLEEFAGELKNKDVLGVSEESSTVHETNIGFPDITIKSKNRLVGWVEVKLPDNSLNSEKNTAQFIRYRESLENILFTNLREWQLWQWDSEGKPQIISELLFDPTSFALNSENDFKNLLLKFFEGKPQSSKTPHQLAIALAKKTKLLSNQVEESVRESIKNEDIESDLLKLKISFESTLVQNTSEHQFSNLIAETLTYSLFLAFLEHNKTHKAEDLTLRTAIDYLPKNVPILFDLYSLISKVSELYPKIYQALLVVIEQLNISDIGNIYKKLTEHKPGEDPVIQFYEPFLKAYDPDEKKTRGVFYTPKPIVDFMIRCVDQILEKSFTKKDGLADYTVSVLDPATGTGTFLMSAIQEIYSNISKENKALGEEIVSKKFNEIVANHILKHFHGFELMVAPYAIAHLKLTILLEDLGFNFKFSESDGDMDNDRLKIYLANTLDDPNKPPKLDIPGYHIAEETNKANEVKNSQNIMVVVGNPPYSLVSSNLLPFAKKFVEKYKYIDGQKIKERGALQFEKIINDDYVKFISFGEEIINKNKSGILAYITNNSFLDNPTMRGMRLELLNNFDEIYIVNLNGSNKKRIKNVVDENVFAIEQGVTITIMVKGGTINEKANVHYLNLLGTKVEKFNYLNVSNFSDVPFITLNPSTPNYFFTPKDTVNNVEYDKYANILETFPLKSIGFFTSRDSLVINYDKEKIQKRINEFIEFIGDNKSICEHFDIPEKKGWNISKAREKVRSITDISNSILKFNHRPFDSKYIFYDRGLVWSPSLPVMKNTLKHDNLNLCVSRQLAALPWNHVFCSNTIVELCYITNKTREGNHVFPLYLYDDQGLFGDSRIANIDKNMPNSLSKNLKLTYLGDGKGDCVNTFGPEDIFYYTYAIFHCPTYRSRYAEQLKIDFPRLPITSDKKLFAQLVKLGNELVNLHLLGENPFDKSKTIFNDKSKWGVTPQTIEKPDDFPDWKVNEVRFDENKKRVYVNQYQFFEGVEKNVWEFMVGGYQVCDKWLKDRKKAERQLSLDDLIQYIKVTVSLRETVRIMGEIDKAIPSWPME